MNYTARFVGKLLIWQILNNIQILLQISFLLKIIILNANFNAAYILTNQFLLHCVTMFTSDPIYYANHLFVNIYTFI